MAQDGQCSLFKRKASQPASQTDRQTKRQADRTANKQTEKKAGRQNGKQTDRQKGRQEDRKADRQTERRTNRQTGWTFINIQIPKQPFLRHRKSIVNYYIHSYFDNVKTNFIINNRTDAWKTDINLLNSKVIYDKSVLQPPWSHILASNTKMDLKKS